MTFLTNTHFASHCAAPRKVTLSTLLSLNSQRRALADMDQATLKDIGLTRDAAAAEARRPFWDIPAEWLK